MPRVCLRAGLSKELLGADKTEIMQDDISVIKVIVMRFAGFFLCIVSVFAQEKRRMMGKTLGQRMKECRVKKGMTQEVLAEILYTKKSTISEYENDKIDLKYSVLKEIAKALDTSVSYLTGEQDEDMEEVLQMAIVLKQIKNRDLRKAAIEQVRVLARI